MRELQMTSVNDRRLCFDGSNRRGDSVGAGPDAEVLPVLSSKSHIPLRYLVRSQL